MVYSMESAQVSSFNVVVWLFVSFRSWYIANLQKNAWINKRSASKFDISINFIAVKDTVNLNFLENGWHVWLDILLYPT